jgi:hypothetical protein
MTTGAIQERKPKAGVRGSHFRCSLSSRQTQIQMKPGFQREPDMPDSSDDYNYSLQHQLALAFEYVKADSLKSCAKGAQVSDLSSCFRLSVRLG